MSSDSTQLYGLMTGLDVLNDFHDPETYWYLKFGFNVSSAQELFINFGYLGIPIYLLFSFVIGCLIKRYYANVSNGADPVY